MGEGRVEEGIESTAVLARNLNVYWRDSQGRKYNAASGSNVSEKIP
jgi:hypothetical protein